MRVLTGPVSTTFGNDIMDKATNSLAEQHRKQLESSGEYVIRANEGWFAVFPPKLTRLRGESTSRNRPPINFVVYRTKYDEPRDHYVIPNGVMAPLLSDATLTHSDVNGTDRWNLVLDDAQLKVSHRKGLVDVSPYYGNRLLTEAALSGRDNGALRAPEEISSNSRYREGHVCQVTVNRYERDPKARERCIEIHGAQCAVCDMKFSHRYGQMMVGFIHVHHLRPISELGESYEVNPQTDLIPLCPNCHAVVHSRTPPFSMDEVKGMLKNGEPNKKNTAYG